jgi:hypothetical protein
MVMAMIMVMAIVMVRASRLRNSSTSTRYACESGELKVFGIFGLFLLLSGLPFRSSFGSLDHGLDLDRIGHVDFTELGRAVIFGVGLGRVGLPLRIVLLE